MLITLKKLIIVAIILLPGVAMAQSDTQPLIMQMRDGKIYFDNTYSLDPKLKKDELFSRAANWFKDAFPYPEKGIDLNDDKKGELSGIGIFKIVTSSSGNYYWIKFKVSIVVHNATYELKLYDIYEKPIESGISNEYSKIEYRWWDFRQGKPWSAEDKTLFSGLEKNIGETLASLETAMSK